MADYSNLKTEILSDIQSDPQIKASVNKINKKIKDGTAKYSDAVELSKALGKTTSKYLKANAVEVTDELLGEFADEVLAPIYKSMQNTSIAASKEVQRIFNKKSGLSLNPVEVKPDESRINHIVDRFKEAETLDTVSFLMGEGVAENIARGAVTDSLKENARAMDRAGLETYVIREGNGCCSWCDEVSGTYPINDVPKDFWRVHKGCTCSIEYKSQNKHTKITYSTDDKGNISKNVHFKTEGMTQKEYFESKNPLLNFNPVDSALAVPYARKEGKLWIEKINEDAKILLNKYTYNKNDSSPKFYERINSFIRNGYTGEKDYTKQVNIISDALKQSKLKNDYKCYRGSNFNPFEGMQIGEKRTAKQFLSTSVARNKSFAGKYNIIIYAQKGTNAGYIEELAHEDFKNQREMLFDKDVLYELLYKQGNNIIVRTIP